MRLALELTNAGEMIVSHAILRYFQVRGLDDGDLCNEALGATRHPLDPPHTGRQIVRQLMLIAAIAGLNVAVGGSGRISAQEGDRDNAPGPRVSGGKEKDEVKADANTFLAGYQTKLAEFAIRANLAYWKAANSGQEEDYEASAAATLALRKFHSDPDAYRRLENLVGAASELPRVEARALRLAELSYRRNQLPSDLLERIVELSTEIEQRFSTFRGEIDGKKLANNDLLEMLREEDNSDRRKAIWEALKQVGHFGLPVVAGGMSPHGRVPNVSGGVRKYLKVL